MKTKKVGRPPRPGVFVRVVGEIPADLSRQLHERSRKSGQPIARIMADALRSFLALSA